MHEKHHSILAMATACALQQAKSRPVKTETLVLKEFWGHKAMLGPLDHKVCKAFKSPMGLLAAKG